MGISGLTSFMGKEYLNDVFEDIKLKDCTLLVDGYSLLHKINYIYNIQSTYGGNYDEFAIKLNNLFDKFKKCKIEAIFLLDGGRDLEDRKFRTSLKRANQRIYESSVLNSYAVGSKKKKFSKINLESLISSGNYRILSNLLPIMAFKIFFSLLNKHQIIHYQCCFEADYDLACLANELKCPLLSCDSDFYIYNLKYGYISIDHIEFEELCEQNESDASDKNESFYFPARIYYIDKFLEFYNSRLEYEGELKKEMLTVFAVLCGNDYVDKSTFDSLLSTFDSTNNNLKFRRLKRNISGFIKRKTTLYHRILDWLSQFENIDECIEMILRFIKSDKRELVKKVIEDSIKEYMCLKPSFSEYFKNLINEKLDSKFKNLSSLQNCCYDHLINLDIKTHEGKFLGKKAIKNFFDCELSRFCLDILIHRKIIFICQLEVSLWPSTYLTSIDIRKLYYTILIKTFENELRNLSKPIIIQEYLRYQNGIKIYDININDKTNQFLNLNVSTIDGYFILSKLFGFNEQICNNFITSNCLNKNLCNKLKYYFAILYFWINCGKSNEEYNELVELKNQNFIRAFIVSFMKCSIIDPCFSFSRNKVADISDNKENNKTIHQYEKFDKCLINEYFSTTQDSANEFLTEFKNNEILSNQNNYEYIKDIRIKLNSFVVASKQINNITNKTSASKMERFLNLKIIHCLCEFQAIYLSLSYIQDILKIIKEKSNDFILLDLDNFFNSAFLHNFIEELENRKNPDLYIEELFGRKSLFKHLYYEFYGLFNTMFQINEISNTASAPNGLTDSSGSIQLTKSQKKNAKKKLKKEQMKNLELESKNEINK